MFGILTVQEREYWKDRIEKQIQERVEAIFADNPPLLERTQRESHRRALMSLGVLTWQEELDSIEDQKTALDQRKRKIERSMLAHICGVPVEDIKEFQSRRHHRDLEQIIKRRQAVHRDELLAENKIGQQILKLLEQKESLGDAIWLATSLNQIHEVWSKVTDLIKDEQKSASPSPNPVD